jgi:hypothetical protein
MMKTVKLGPSPLYGIDVDRPLPVGPPRANGTKLRNFSTKVRWQLYSAEWDRCVDGVVGELTVRPEEFP